MGSRGLVQRWLHDCVLALELCPFAAPVVRDGSLRIAISDAVEPAAQLRDFLLELDRLQSSPEQEISTTLLAFSQQPQNFDDFLDLVGEAQALLEESGLEGLVQLAHFHPLYQFANEAADGLSHYSNRSPLPIIHLIRESMLTRVLTAIPDPAEIPRANMARLEAMGRDEVQRRWQALLVEPAPGD
jgi:hypothetical protein